MENTGEVQRHSSQVDEETKRQNDGLILSRQAGSVAKEYPESIGAGRGREREQQASSARCESEIAATAHRCVSL